MRQNHIALAAATAVVISCGGETMTNETQPLALATIESINAEDWNWLANQKIFFGHQSVGRNIMSGLNAILAEHGELALTITNNDSLTQVASAGFVEANVGRNGDPASKRAAFERAIANMGEGQRIAMLKYCYADITPDTDVRTMFRDYEAHMTELKAQNPELVIVHFTLPLRTSTSTWKDHVKRLIGRTPPITLSARRNEFNRLLLERYSGNEPVFDLARIESTRADGTRSTVRYFGDDVYILSPEWTDDGGHLNDAAQRRVAEQLLVFLARLRPGMETGAVAASGNTNGIDAGENE